MVHVFCEHLSPVDESACNPKPKSLRQTGRYPFNAEHNDLANDRIARDVCGFHEVVNAGMGVSGGKHI